MLGSLDAAVSGLDVFQQDLNVIGNNIANVNTDGFKDARANLGNSFDNTLVSAVTGSAPLAIGTGVNIDSTSQNWTNATLNTTGQSSDLGIQGNGFFLVKDPVSGAIYATQVGNFSLDASGNLIVTNTDLQVQGQPVGAAAGTLATINIAAVTTTGITNYNVDAL